LDFFLKKPAFPPGLWSAFARERKKEILRGKGDLRRAAMKSEVRRAIPGIRVREPDAHGAAWGFSMHEIDV
jgi:hypothetical protein